jgi:hypothetical protein
MLILALALAAPTPLTAVHERDIACIVEIAILADEQKRGVQHTVAFPDVTDSGKRWTGLVGAQIVWETGQPREIIAFAMSEAAKARQTLGNTGANLGTCIIQMTNQLATADAINAPLPKPLKAR